MTVKDFKKYLERADDDIILDDWPLNLLTAAISSEMWERYSPFANRRMEDKKNVK